MLELASRAFLIVFCTAMNVVFISRRQWVAMAVTGFLLSWIWWWNTQTAAYTPGFWPSVAYATGAGLGTLAGAWVANGWGRT